MLDSTVNPQLQIPVESQPILDAIAEKIGFVPNLFSTLASQTKVLEAFVALDNAFGETSLNPVERQAVLLAASVENQSGYCVAGHTGQQHEKILAENFPDRSVDMRSGYAAVAIRMGRCHGRCSLRRSKGRQTLCTLD